MDTITSTFVVLAFIALWFSPYYWVSKVRDDVMVEIIIWLVMAALLCLVLYWPACLLLILAVMNIPIAYIKEQEKRQEKNSAVQNSGGSKEDFLAVFSEQMKRYGPPATPPVMKDYPPQAETKVVSKEAKSALHYSCRHESKPVQSFVASVTPSPRSGHKQTVYSKSSSFTSDDDYVRTSFEQDEAMKDYADRCYSTGDSYDITDHEGNIDYDKVDAANNDMDYSISCNQPS